MFTNVNINHIIATARASRDHFNQKDEEFLSHIVSGVEKQISHVNAETKQQSKELKTYVKTG